MTEREGVIKYSLDFTDGVLGEPASLGVLDAWRSIFKDTGLLGEDPDRYGGYGFGNLSVRTARGFLITGSQTGNLATTSSSHYAEVVGWSLEDNAVSAIGPIRPSSEALTHAAIYDAFESIRYVFHVHSPDIWRQSQSLSLPSTAAEIAYGTVDMALALKQLAAASGPEGIMTMLGHEDGVMSWGASAEKAGTHMIGALVRSKSLPVAEANTEAKK